MRSLAAFMAALKWAAESELFTKKRESQLTQPIGKLTNFKGVLLWPMISSVLAPPISITRRFPSLSVVKAAP